MRISSNTGLTLKDEKLLSPVGRGGGHGHWPKLWQCMWLWATWCLRMRVSSHGRGRALAAGIEILRGLSLSILVHGLHFQPSAVQLMVWREFPTPGDYDVEDWQ